MSKPKVEFYLGSLKEVVNVMESVKDLADSSKDNPFGVWLDINVMMEEDKIGKITLNEYDDLVFRPNLEYFKGDY